MSMHTFGRGRVSFLAVAALGLGAAALSLNVRAEDAKAGDATVSTMSADDHKLMMAEVEKIKAMAGPLHQADKLKLHMAKMITMDNMAKQMALDTECKQECLSTMNDPQVKKIHDEAVLMATDPQEMEKLQKEIMADPVLVKIVTHRAMTMSLVVASGGTLENVTGKWKDMGDQLKNAGSSLLRQK